MCEIGTEHGCDGGSRARGHLAGTLGPARALPQERVIAFSRRRWDKAEAQARQRNMVVLNRIYTRTGDAGETALGNGERVSKASLRIAAYGTVDETNAVLGIVRLHTAGADMAKLDAMLARIQNELFDLAVAIARR